MSTRYLNPTGAVERGEAIVAVEPKPEPVLYVHGHFERRNGQKDTFYTRRVAYRQYMDGKLYARLDGCYRLVPKSLTTRRKSGEVIQYVWRAAP